MIMIGVRYGVLFSWLETGALVIVMISPDCSLRFEPHNSLDASSGDVKRFDKVAWVEALKRG